MILFVFPSVRPFVRAPCPPHKSPAIARQSFDLNAEKLLAHTMWSLLECLRVSTEYQQQRATPLRTECQYALAAQKQVLAARVCLCVCDVQVFFVVALPPPLLAAHFLTSRCQFLVSVCAHFRLVIFHNNFFVATLRASLHLCGEIRVFRFQCAAYAVCVLL